MQMLDRCIKCQLFVLLLGLLHLFCKSVLNISLSYQFWLLKWLLLRLLMRLLLSVLLLTLLLRLLLKLLLMFFLRFLCGIITGLLTWLFCKRITLFLKLLCRSRDACLSFCLRSLLSRFILRWLCGDDLGTMCYDDFYFLAVRSCLKDRLFHGVILNELFSGFLHLGFCFVLLLWLRLLLWLLLSLSFKFCIVRFHSGHLLFVFTVIFLLIHFLKDLLWEDMVCGQNVPVPILLLLKATRIGTCSWERLSDVWRAIDQTIHRASEVYFLPKTFKPEEPPINSKCVLGWIFLNVAGADWTVGPVNMLDASVCKLSLCCKIYVAVFLAAV